MTLRFLLAFTLLFTSSACGEVFEISAIINTDQEIPAPSGVPDGAGGFAHLTYDDISKELSWNIAWQSLSGPAAGMHFHAPAAPGAAAGVAVNIGDISGLSSPSVGATTISDDFAANLMAGESYINIHTAANGPGEIRGQVNPENINLFATLDTGQEIPPPTGVPINAGGEALMAYDPATNLLGWHIEWENLSGPAVGMHLHGPAGLGETAGVQINVGDISGLTSPSIGSTTISDELEGHLLGGQIYLNVHTAANGPGEIRGQIVPEPATSLLMLMGFFGILRIARRRNPR